MTAQHALQAQPTSSQDPVAFDGGMRVARAGRIEAAAGPNHGTDQQLIAADHPHQEFAGRYHFWIDFQCSSRLVRNSREVAARAPSRADTVTSTGGNECWFKRKDSRARRLMRLRATALPKVRVAMLKPNRAWVSWLARADTLKNASENFLPRRFTSRNSAGWCKRLRGSNVNLRIGSALKGSRYGQSFLRPLARRRASNRRPLLVAMRARKPWVRARCKLLGLKVRFIAARLEQKPRGKSMSWAIYEGRQGY